LTTNSKKPTAVFNFPDYSYDSARSAVSGPIWILRLIVSRAVRILHLIVHES